MFFVGIDCDDRYCYRSRLSFSDLDWRSFCCKQYSACTPLCFKNLCCASCFCRVAGELWAADSSKCPGGGAQSGAPRRIHQQHPGPKNQDSQHMLNQPSIVAQCSATLASVAATPPVARHLLRESLTCDSCRSRRTTGTARPFGVFRHTVAVHGIPRKSVERRQQHVQRDACTVTGGSCTHVQLCSPSRWNPKFGCKVRLQPALLS